MEIEDGMLEPDLSIFLSYVNAIGIDGRQLIDWEKHTNVYNHLESLTPAEAEILSKTAISILKARNELRSTQTTLLRVEGLQNNKEALWNKEL